MSLKNILYIVALVALVACAGNRNKVELSEEVNTLKFDPAMIEDTPLLCNLSDHYKSISGFSLDKSEAPIGIISKLKIFEDKLFVLDERYAKKIFVFDLTNSGNFLFSIGKKGKGPGEFLNISDFAIDTREKRLIVTDDIQQKVTLFDLNGNLIDVEKLDFKPLKVFRKDEYYYFISMCDINKDCGLKITNTQFNIKKELFPHSNYPVLTNYGNNFIEFEGKTLLSYPCCDTIFQINNLEIKPYLIIESGQHSFKLYSDIKKLNPSNNIHHLMSYRKNKELKETLIPVRFFEDNKLQLFGFRYNNRFREFVKNKANSQKDIYLGKIYNDFFKSPIKLVGYHPNYGTIGIASAEAIAKADICLMDKNKDNISSVLVKDIKQANIDGNPFVVFLK